MTADQFNAIRQLIRAKPDSAATLAARLVLIDGRTLQEAEAESGASYTGTWNAVKRYENAYHLITTHFGPGNSSRPDD